MQNGKFNRLKRSERSLRENVDRCLHRHLFGVVLLSVANFFVNFGVIITCVD